MEPEARFFEGETETEADIRCALCPLRCVIRAGSLGACGARGNENGKGALPFYGHVTAMAADPVEKKPLFHFRPSSEILSVGFAGCNLRCPFCQNWRISRSARAPGSRMSPAQIVAAARRENCRAIAYTYSEPLVHAEFLLDCMSLARKNGIANALVTNGCIRVNAAEEILCLADAANIDLKCFSPETYARILADAHLDQGIFETVIAFIRLARAKGVHVEITTLVVPGMNDSPDELDACADFILSLGAETDGPQTPWHLSAYHPAHLCSLPPTDPAFLLKTKKRVGGKLKFVYTGNIPSEENNTLCPCCNALLVRRLGYRAETRGLAPPKDGEAFFRCANCGAGTGILC